MVPGFVTHERERAAHAGDRLANHRQAQSAARTASPRIAACKSLQQLGRAIEVRQHRACQRGHIHRFVHRQRARAHKVEETACQRVCMIDMAGDGFNLWLGLAALRQQLGSQPDTRKGAAQVV